MDILIDIWQEAKNFMFLADIPREVVYQISLLLPYNFLSLNKDLSRIYDESWFESKIKQKYSNCKQHDNSWEFLYRRMLKSGKIFMYRGKNMHNLYAPVEGIKGSGINHRYQSILTFDGDLYTYDIYGNMQLLDSNVININSATYIKKNEWYRWTEINHKAKSYLITTGKNYFLSCLYYSDNFFAITNEKIYQYNHSTGLIITDFDGGVRIIKIDTLVVIQKNDGSLYKYNKQQKIEKLEIGPVQRIFDGCAKLMDDSIITIRYESDRYGKYLWNTKIIIPTNNLQGTIIYYGNLLILLDNNVYKITKDKQLKLIQNNVKSIENGFFVI
jgi:hypothetical protein